MAHTPDASSGATSHDGYILDAENAAEMGRLMLQDHLLTRIMGGPLPEPIDRSQIHHVLDIGCGPGGWLFDLVTQHPDMRGVGIDISNLMLEYANHLAASQKLSNVHFRFMDATQPLQFPDHTFDLINGRIFTSFLSTHQWPALLQECARITRPGGVIRLTEPEWGFSNSAAFDKIIAMETLALQRAGHSFSPNGRTVGTANVLRLLLQKAGYEAIQYRAYAVDYSAGSEDHESNVQNCLVVYKQLQPFFVRMQVTTDDEFQYFYQQMVEDMQKEDFCAIDYYLTVWGQKPASSNKS